MTNSEQGRRVRIGLIGIVTTAAMVLVAQSYEKMPFLSGGDSYSAYFTDSAGLQQGSRVEVAGVTVGEVEDVAIEGDRVLVHFSARGVSVGTASRLAVKTQTVLGTKLLELTPDGRDRIERGEAIPTEQTTVPYSLTDALGDLTDTATGLDTDQVTKALGVLSTTFDQTAPQLGASLDGVTRFSETLASRDQMIQDLLANAESLSKVLSERSTQINSLLLDGNTLFAALDARRQALDTLLTNISAVTQQVKGFIDDNREQLTPVLDQLTQITDLVNERKDELQSAILPLSQYATSLGESVGSGPFFKAYVMNLLPGQFLQPFIDAAFKDEGIDPATLPALTSTWPVGGTSTPGGAATPAPGTGASAPAPATAGPPAPAPGLPGLQLPQIPGLQIPGLGG